MDEEEIRRILVECLGKEGGRGDPRQAVIRLSGVEGFR